MSALLVIDLQNDFCDGGTLAVEGGKSLVEPINSLIHSRKWDLVVGSQDWHPISHISFAVNHADQSPFTECTITDPGLQKSVTTTLWPVHCVQNTEGAEFVKGLDTLAFDAIVRKGQQDYSEFYSAFQDVFQHNKTDLLAILQEHNIEEVVIVGLVFDFCVMHTAIDAVNAGYKTVVERRYTKSISEQTALKAEQEMLSKGVTIL